MHRTHRVAGLLAAIIIAAGMAPAGLPISAPIPALAAGECGAHRSETAPPPTIRVFRTASGAVETVDFRAYVKNVLSREWISSWTTESLRSGALAVKNYAWYQVLHWRGYVNAAGACFDVFDSTRDQHYDPSRPTYASMAAAVDATWGTLAQKGGRIFATYYNAGVAFETCGANANGWQMFQWGTQACGLAGKSAAQIMSIYYPGVTVSSAPPAATPPPAAPSPTPAPVPTAQPTPAPTTPGASIPPSTAPTAAPTPSPAPVPAPPAPTPSPLPVVRPGGGQVGLSAPPPAPPADPEPIVVTVSDGGGARIEATAAGAPARATTVHIGELRGHASVRFERAMDAAARPGPAATDASRRAMLRLIVIGLMIERSLANVPVRMGLGG